MARHVRRFRFETEVPTEDLEAAVFVSVLAAEAIHGRAAVRLNGRFSVDPDGRQIRCHTESDAGKSIASVFTVLASQMFGEDSFVIEEDESDHVTV